MEQKWHQPKLRHVKNREWRRWSVAATKGDLNFSWSHHYRPTHLQQCHSATQNYKNATIGWKWWPNDVDRLTDMAQMWQWCGNHVANISWPYDKCTSSKIWSSKYLKKLEIIIRPINAQLLKIWNNDTMKRSWGKCTNKRQLSTKQLSRIA